MHAEDAKNLRFPRIVRQQNKLRQLIIAMLFCHKRLVWHTNQRFWNPVLHRIKCADLESQLWMNLQNLIKFTEHGLPSMQSVIQVCVFWREYDRQILEVSFRIETFVECWNTVHNVRKFRL